MKKKIKQYSFWTGLAGAVVILLTTLSKAFGFEFEQQIVSDIIMAVCGVLVVFGVVNAPINTQEETLEDLQEDLKIEQPNDQPAEVEQPNQISVKQENNQENLTDNK